MKTTLTVAAVLLLGFVAGFLVRDRLQPVGRYAFDTDNDGYSVRLDTATGEMVLCVPAKTFRRMDPEAYGVTPSVVGK